MRISNAKSHNIDFVTVEYPTVSPWNCDLSRFLLVHVDRFGLYNRKGKFIQTLNFLRADSEPRWSTIDPEWLVYLLGNELWGYNAFSGENFLVHQFDEYRKVSGKGEGDIGKDGYHLVLVGDDEEVFVFNHSSKEKRIVVRESGIDSVMLTSKNDVVVSKNEGPVKIYFRDGTFKDITGANGHKDIGRLDGVDFLVWTNSNDPGVTVPNAVMKVDLETGEQMALVSLDWSLAVNISCSVNGLVLVSTYGILKDVPYSNELLVINMATGSVRSLGKHGSSSSDYTSQPRGVISRYGERVLYGSDRGWGVNVYMEEVD